MFSMTEQISALAKAQLENQFKLLQAVSSTAITGTEKLLTLQLSTGRTALQNSVDAARQLISVNNAQELLNVSASQAQPRIDNALAFGRGLVGIATGTQAELLELGRAGLSPARPATPGDEAPAAPDDAPAAPPAEASVAAPAPDEPEAYEAEANAEAAPAVSGVTGEAVATPSQPFAQAAADAAASVMNSAAAVAAQASSQYAPLSNVTAGTLADSTSDTHSVKPSKNPLVAQAAPIEPSSPDSKENPLAEAVATLTEKPALASVKPLAAIIAEPLDIKPHLKPAAAIGKQSGGSSKGGKK